jgi:hypothetical protein
VSRGASASMMHSLSEFAFLLAFVFLTASALLASGFLDLQAEREALALELEGARGQIAELNAELAYLREKQDAPLPCWQRPDGTIPEVAGILTIRSSRDFEFWHYDTGSLMLMELPFETRNERLAAALQDLFAPSLAYAAERQCYLRVRIINETRRFDLYDELAAMAAGLGLVIIR